MPFRSTAYPTGKPERDNSMPTKQGSPKTLRGELPCGTCAVWLKAGLPETQFPRMDGSSPDNSVWCGTNDLPACMPYGSGALGRWLARNDLAQGDEWEPGAALSRLVCENTGSPTGREPYGDGVPVVVAGLPYGRLRQIPPRHGGRESRLQGEGGQASPAATSRRYA